MELIKVTCKYEMYVKYTYLCYCVIFYINVHKIPLAQTVQGHGFSSQRMHELIECTPWTQDDLKKASANCKKKMRVKHSAIFH